MWADSAFQHAATFGRRCFWLRSDLSAHKAEREATPKSDMKPESATNSWLRRRRRARHAVLHFLRVLLRDSFPHNNFHSRLNAKRRRLSRWTAIMKAGMPSCHVPQSANVKLRSERSRQVRLTTTFANAWALRSGTCFFFQHLDPSLGMKELLQVYLQNLASQTKVSMELRF